MSRRFKCIADGYNFIVCDNPFNTNYILKIFAIGLIKPTSIDIVIIDTITQKTEQFTESFKSGVPVIKCFLINIKKENYNY